MNLPSSNITFPDGAHYRIEVSGMETPGVLEAVIDEAKRLGIPIHRAIATVGGSMWWTEKDLKNLAKIANENRIEVIVCPGNLARGLIENPNNLFNMMNWQNDAQATNYIQEIRRCLNLGFRGFLVWRKGMLGYLDRLRADGHIPSETIFKISTFDNNSNIADFMLACQMGADTINTANGLWLETLCGFRRVEDVVMDVHMTFWQLHLEKRLVRFKDTDTPSLTTPVLLQSVKPYDRIADAPEIARICAPVYFKFEAGNPGIGVYDLSGPNWTEKDLIAHKRGDVQTAAIVIEKIKRKHPDLKLSDWGPADLRVPVV